MSGAQAELDVLTFAHRTGAADLFPGLDRRLVQPAAELQRRALSGRVKLWV